MSRLTMKERFELFAKCGAFGNLEDLMLQESSVSFLMIEQLENDDVQKLRTSIANSKKVVNQAKSSLADKFPKSLGPYLSGHASNLDKAEQLASKIDLSNPEGLKGMLSSMLGGKVDVGRALQGVLEIEAQSNQSLETFKNAIALIHRNLDGKLEDDTKLSEIPADVGITSDQLKDAVKKAFKGAGKKGVFAKMAGFFKEKAADIPGAEEVGEFPAEEFATELLELPFKELKALASGTQKLEPPAPNEDAITDVNQKAEEETTETPGEETTETPGEDAEETPGEDTEEPDAPENPDQEQAENEAALDAAVSAEENQAQSPLKAAMDAVDGWVSGLSPSSQQTLKRGKRDEELKTGIQSAVEDVAGALQKAVKGSIDKWVGTHGETLIKSKRFKKGTFENMSDTIADLMANLMISTNESGIPLTKNKVQKSVYSYLNRKYLTDYDSMISESSKIMDRWNHLAGLDHEN